MYVAKCIDKICILCIKEFFFVLNNCAEKSMNIIRFHENEYRNIQRVVYIFIFDKDAHNVAITCWKRNSNILHFHVLLVRHFCAA